MLKRYIVLRAETMHGSSTTWMLEPYVSRRALYGYRVNIVGRDRATP
jgi:hypothetical protein